MNNHINTKVILGFIFLSAIASIALFYLYIHFKTDILKVSTFQPYALSTFREIPQQQLLAGQKIDGSFRSQENYLNGIKIRFVTYRRINTDSLVFRITAKNGQPWMYQTTLNSQNFSGSPLYSIYFPTQETSKGITYYFEIESLYGKPGNAINIATFEPSFISIHTYPNVLSLRQIVFYSYLFTVIFIFFLSILSLVYMVTVHKQSVILLGKREFSVRNLKLIMIFLLGLSMRLLIATYPSLNFDMENFMIDSQIFLEGKWNIYLLQNSYNYSPAIFYIIGILGYVNNVLFSLPYPIIHRTFLSIFDIISALVLYVLSKKYRMSPLKVVDVFLLNPVSILLSAHQAHFENVALSGILLGVWILSLRDTKNWLKQAALWITVTLSVIVKHIVIFQAMLLLVQSFRQKTEWKGWLLFLLTIVAFLLTFAPFYPTASGQINEYVFGYQGLATISGVTGFMYQFCPKCSVWGFPMYTIYKYVFIAGFVGFIYIVKKFSILRSVFLSTLFFLSFTSAHAAQYLILPIALGSFFPSRLYVLYSVSVTLLLIQNAVGIRIPGIVSSATLFVLLLNSVWLCSLVWFYNESKLMFSNPLYDADKKHKE